MSTAERVGSQEFTEEQQILIRHLFKSQCIRFGDFELSSGRRSPYILDLAYAQHDAVLSGLIAEGYTDLIKKNYFDTDLISGVPSASIPTATLIASKLGMGMVTARIKEISDNGKVQVDGFNPSFVGRSVLIVDDAATTGGSIIRSADALRKKGIVVDRAMVLLDRQEGAREALEEYGIRFFGVFGARELFNYAKDAKTKLNQQEHFYSNGESVLSKENYEAVISYIGQVSKPI